MFGRFPVGVVAVVGRPQGLVGLQPLEVAPRGDLAHEAQTRHECVVEFGACVVHAGMELDRLAGLPRRHVQMVHPLESMCETHLLHPLEAGPTPHDNRQARRQAFADVVVKGRSGDDLPAIELAGDRRRECVRAGTDIAGQRHRDVQGLGADPAHIDPRRLDSRAGVCHQNDVLDVCPGRTDEGRGECASLLHTHEGCALMLVLDRDREIRVGRFLPLLGGLRLGDHRCLLPAGGESAGHA